MGVVKLLPVFHARPWGRRSLAPLYPFPAEAQGPIGEAWLTSTECPAVDLEGGQGEEKLAELWEEMSAAERGAGLAESPRFPLLVKILFTADKLSIQLHPDDAFAREEENEPWGKTEMWHVLEAEAGAWVKVGMRPGVEAEEVRARLGGAEMDDLMQTIPVRAGDAIFVPAGTLHAIGPGLVLCEVQQYSDVTYRVYDYDRPGLDGQPRPLHLEQARRALRLGAPEAGLRPTLPGTAGGGRVLVSCPVFTVERYSQEAVVEIGSSRQQFDLLVCCAGAGTLSWAGGRVNYGPGEAFLVPADCAARATMGAAGALLRVIPAG